MSNAFRLLLALLVLAFAARAARAHAPPPVYLNLQVDEEAVHWEMTVMAGVFQVWTGVDTAALAAGDEETIRRAEEGAAGLLEAYGHLTIDTVAVQPRLTDVQYTTFTDHALDWEYVRIRATYGSKGVPRQMEVGWTNFDGGISYYFEEIQAEVTLSGVTEYFTLHPNEPGFVWHRPQVPPPPRRPAFRPPDGPTLLLVPALSIGLLLLLLLALPWLRRLERRRAWATVGVFAFLALATAGTARTSIVVSRGAKGERPSEAEARYVFEGLLRNIYRAFDYDTEDEIYETLAQSVTGDLLDRIYTEVYASLVLQEEGGAVCKVQRVDLLVADVSFPPGEATPWFRVRAKWRVHGKVGHWGHTHVRVNEYEAVYTVARSGSDWRIADVQVLEQRRVDDGSRR